MPVHSADPDLLRRLAIDLEAAAEEAVVAAAAATRLCGDTGPVLIAAGVERWAVEWARSLAERASLLGDLGPVAATLVEAGDLDRRVDGADHALNTPEPVAWHDLEAAVTAAWITVSKLVVECLPDRAAAHLTSLDPLVAATLARRRPEVGDIPGAPLPVAFAANRRRVELAVADLDRRLSSADPVAAVALAAERDLLAGMLGRNLVRFDWAGDGVIAEWVGSLDADHVVVLVPGMGTDKLDAGAMAANAARIVGLRRRGDLAVVTALVYDAPEGADAALPVAAGAGVPGLAGLVEALPVADRHLTIVAHSYGAMVVGGALGAGLADRLPDRHDVIFVGAPGTGVPTAEGLGLDPGVVWAGGTVDDPVILFRRLLGWLGPLPVAVYADAAFGTPPTDRGFGAHRFEAGAGGHSGYFGSEAVEPPGSLRHPAVVTTPALMAIVAIATHRSRPAPPGTGRRRPFPAPSDRPGPG